MRAKLERIAAGKIEYGKGRLKLTPADITISCTPDETAEGSFTLSSDRQVRGIVYASTDRMAIDRQSFHGRNARISYSFDASGLWGGETFEGAFCIVSEAGEYSLPYTVKVEEHVPPKENYTYFVTADPIEPMAVDGAAAVTGRVVELTDGAKAPDSEMTKEQLESIISQLIKNGDLSPESFAWYKRGVDEELKLADLYEYFMMTVPEDYHEKLPQNLLLYFQMENRLDDGRKALLYANVIRYQPPLSEIYRAYADEIEEFMLDQLLKRHISKDLSVIYREFLMEDILTIDFAEGLADIMFLRLFKCQDRRIREVQVFYDQLQNPIRVPVNDGLAYLPIYTPGAVLLLADARGNLYSTSVPYTLEKLMDERRFAGKCRELLRYHQGLYLYLCDGTSKSHRLTPGNVENYKRILKISGFTARYREEVRQEILQYYYDNDGLDGLDRDFFITQTESMNPKERGKYTEILVMRGLYDDAWDMIRTCGYGTVKVSCLIKLAAWRIKETEYADDGVLVRLCLYIFENHKYDESILEYLSWYYYGSTEVLVKIWKEARDFEINVFELEERILAQMLFTEDLVPDSFDIFRDYRACGGGGLVDRAYLAYVSYQDFVREEKVPDGFQECLADAVDWEEDLPDVCLLSYLRALSSKRKLGGRDRAHADRLVDHFLRRKICYGFMKTLGVKLSKPWILEDRIFIEYRTDPSHKVVLHYCIEIPGEGRVDYVTERLYPSQPGVFVKEFTLFYGWRLTWFISETGKDGDEKLTPDKSYTEKNQKDLSSGTKYAYIYEMSREQSRRSTPGLEKKLMEYGEKNFLVESLFTLK